MLKYHQMDKLYLIIKTICIKILTIINTYINPSITYRNNEYVTMTYFSKMCTWLKKNDITFSALF